MSSTKFSNAIPTNVGKNTYYKFIGGESFNGQALRVAKARESHKGDGRLNFDDGFAVGTILRNNTPTNARTAAFLKKNANFTDAGVDGFNFARRSGAQTNRYNG